MKKPLTIIAFIIALCLSGCGADKYDEVVFRDTGGLKAQLGERFLYPDPSAAGYEPGHTDIRGYHYTRTDTWDYNIDFHDYAYGSAEVNEEVYRLIEEGLPVVVYIQVKAFEQKHRASKHFRGREFEIGVYKDILEGSPNNVWDIGGVTVAYAAGDISERSLLGFLDPVTFFVREDLQEKFDTYRRYMAYAAFFHNEIFYTVEIQVNAPADESMTTETAVMAHAVIKDMIE